jgi:hypothetical protein
MNRRQFLQSLAALGYGIALPASTLADAPDAVIEQAWEAAVGNPYTFYVDSRGILSFSKDELWARPRAELLGLLPVTSTAGLFKLADEVGTFGSILAEEHARQRALDPTIASDWRSWVTAARRDTAAGLIRRANAWLEEIAAPADWRLADLKGYTDRGQALAFFRDEFGFNDLFDIAIFADGDPDSTFVGARLQTGLDEANLRAVANRLPIHFVPWRA